MFWVRSSTFHGSFRGLAKLHCSDTLGKIQTADCFTHILLHRRNLNHHQSFGISSCKPNDLSDKCWLINSRTQPLIFSVVAFVKQHALLGARKPWQTRFQILSSTRLNSPFLERAGNFVGPEPYFKIKIKRIEKQVLAP